MLGPIDSIGISIFIVSISNIVTTAWAHWATQLRMKKQTKREVAPPSAASSTKYRSIAVHGDNLGSQNKAVPLQHVSMRVEQRGGLSDNLIESLQIFHWDAAALFASERLLSRLAQSGALLARFFQLRAPLRPIPVGVRVCPGRASSCLPPSRRAATSGHASRSGPAASRRRGQGGGAAVAERAGSRPAGGTARRH